MSGKSGDAAGVDNPGFDGEKEEKLEKTEAENLNSFGPSFSDEGFRGSRAGMPYRDPETELETIFSDIQKEIEESMTRLASSKDRAQMTANTALSLSLIVVLKELIDLGPGGNKYYYVNVTLVSLSLLCQVVIGFLALIMYTLKSKDDVNKRRSAKISTFSMEMPNRPLHYHADAAEKDMVKERVKNTVSLQWYRDIYQRLLQEERDTIMPGCINCDDYTDSEQALIRLHEFITEELTPVFLEPVVGEYTTSYGAITGGGSSRSSSGGTGSGDKPQRLKVVEGQVALKVRMIRRKKLLDNISTVQNAITYLMYIVFILNAFITGFGLS